VVYAGDVTCLETPLMPHIGGLPGELGMWRRAFFGKTFRHESMWGVPVGMPVSEFRPSFSISKTAEQREMDRNSFSVRSDMSIEDRTVQLN
jgi:hypothetical protein